MTTGTGSASSTSTTIAAHHGSTSSGLSTGARAGIGIGAGVAGLVIAGACIGWYFSRRKEAHQRKQQHDGDEAALASSQQTGTYFSGDSKLEGYGHFAAAKRGSSLLDESGRPEDSMISTTSKPGPLAVSQALALAASHDESPKHAPLTIATPKTNTVYVPAYELPGSPERTNLEMPGAPLSWPALVVPASERGLPTRTAAGQGGGGGEARRSIYTNGAQYAVPVSDVTDTMRPPTEEAQIPDDGSAAGAGGGAALAALGPDRPGSSSDQNHDEEHSMNAGNRMTGATTVSSQGPLSPVSELDSTPTSPPEFLRRPSRDIWNSRSQMGYYPARHSRHGSNS